MSFFTRRRKRQRPSSTSEGDEVCTSWYSTDPRDLPPGFSVGSMSVPYPPPYYSQNPYGSGSRKKKKDRKSRFRKNVPAQERTGWRFVHEVTRLQKSRALNEGVMGEEASPTSLDDLHVCVPLDGVIQHKPDRDGGVSQPLSNPSVPGNVSQPIPDASIPDGLPQPISKTSSAPDGVPQPILETPMLDGISPHPITESDAPIPATVNSVAMEPVAVKETKHRDVVEPPPAKEQVDSKVDHGTEKPQILEVVGLKDSPKGSRKMALQRSCSMNDVDELSCHEGSPQNQHLPRKSSSEAEDIIKRRGISFDEVQSARQAKRRGPYLTHQPRSYQVVHRSTSSENRNLAALGCSPDLRKKPRSISKRTLYKPKNVEVLIDTIRTGTDVNTIDEITGYAPIHAIVMGKRRRDRLELLMALLIYGKVKVDLPNRKKMTALHLAIEDGDEMCVRALLAFGANVNAVGRNNHTPLDLVMNKGTMQDIGQALIQMGAVSSSQQMRELRCPVRNSVPRLYSFAENMKPPPISDQSVKLTGDMHSEFANQNSVMELYRDLEVKVNQKFSLSASYSDKNETPDDAYALLVQQRELNHFNKTLRKRGFGVFSGVEGGSRILFLDGGGIKGLVQLEILMQLEEKTGRKITELFDWIVGTSTGGVITLALVYGKKSLQEIFQLYFMMKDRIFSKSRIGFGFNTEVLEEILQEYLDPDIKMTDVTHPKVLISAVSKATTNLELHFFNNCFGDDYMDYPVWKVARYTSATPMFFSECDNYIDGGVICNNPTEYGLTTIQNFFRQQGKKLPIALVVSIGTGVYPAVELGSIDLFLGIQALTHIKQRTQNLISLLGNALVESEMVATNSQSRCTEQGIPFYRFSPKLKDVIAGSETDNEKLFNMVIQTRIDTREQGMEELVGQFHTIARASLHLAPKVEGNGGEEEAKQERQEGQVQQEKKEEREVTANVSCHANVNHRANRSLQLNVRPHASQSVLSDIEESLEGNSRKSFKSRHATSSSVHAKSVHMLGEAGQMTSGTHVLIAAQTASGLGCGGDAEEECRPAKDHNCVSSEESTTADLHVAGERSDFDNASSEQSVVEKVPQTRTSSEVCQIEQEVMTESQESSVFSIEIASSNELQTSLLTCDKEKDDDNGNSTNAVCHHEEPAYYVDCDSGSAAPHTEQLALAEPEERVKNMTTVDNSHDHNHHSSIPTTFRMSSSQESKIKAVMESGETRQKDASLNNMSSPRPLVTPLEQEQPLSPAKPVGLVENQTRTAGQSSASPQMLQQCLSQETTIDTNGGSCTDSSSPHSSSNVVDCCEGELENGKEEICTNQNQQTLHKVNSEIADPPESVVNGVTVLRGSIPEGNMHSLPINPESPLTNGPPKSLMPQSKLEESAVTLSPNGHTLLSESEAVASHPTRAELHHEPSGMVNGCKSHTHTQIHNLQTTGEQQKAVPQLLKVEHPQTPETQQEMESNFPYQFETEI